MKTHIAPRNAVLLPTFLLLAFLPLAGAYCQQPAPQDPVQRAADTQRAIAALPPACTLGAPGPATRRAWLNTDTAIPESSTGPRVVTVYGFDKPVRTRVLRVALDRLALKTLEKAETRDAQGNWIDAGQVSGRAAPVGCEYVWLEQALPQTREVEALRFTFRREDGTMTSANAGVLREAAP
jgi:hypothetical protein